MLVEVESCVNSRPLVVSGDDIDDRSPITPNHFIIGRATGFHTKAEAVPETVSGASLSSRARLREKRLQKFWNVWSEDYLRNLPPDVRKFRTQGKLKEGSVCIIREDNMPRRKWLLGVVTKLFPGRDGVARSAQVRTERGLKTRAIQRLCDLEVLR